MVPGALNTYSTASKEPLERCRSRVGWNPALEGGFCSERYLRGHQPVAVSMPEAKKLGFIETWSPMAGLLLRQESLLTLVDMS